MVTPSSIPSSATRKSDADLSSNKEFEEVLEGSKDEPVIRTKVSDFDEDNGGGDHENEAMRICLLSLTDLLLLFFLQFPSTIL